MEGESIAEDGIGTAVGTCWKAKNGNYNDPSHNSAGYTNFGPPPLKAANHSKDGDQELSVKEVGFNFNVECTSSTAMQPLPQNSLTSKLRAKVAKSASLDCDTSTRRVAAETAPDEVDQQPSLGLAGPSQESNPMSFITGRTIRPSGGGHHVRSRSIGATVKFEDSMEDINSRWRCFPEIRHMSMPSMPEGMMTMEDGKERMMQTAEAMKLRMIQAGRDVSNKYKEWKVIAYQHLPEWLRDNDYLHKGHRPPLPSVCTCFKSVFKIHTETGNIWTHILGSVAVIMLTVFFLLRSITRHYYLWTDVAVIVTFFICALLCLTFSWLFHTLHCHSNKYRLLFNKLDYVGIAVLVVGSFVPWLYYGFYCNDTVRLVYISSINILGIVCIIISLWDRFSAPVFRPLRAGMYIVLGLSAIVPAVHFIAINGLRRGFYEASFGWLLLMAFLYISGACLYALRIPERFFPGKFDIWGHSHQIFHVFVVAAIFVHYYGIEQVATHRAFNRNCATPSDFCPNQTPVGS